MVKIASDQKYLEYASHTFKIFTGYRGQTNVQLPPGQKLKKYIIIPLQFFGMSSNHNSILLNLLNKILHYLKTALT